MLQKLIIIFFLFGFVSNVKAQANKQHFRQHEIGVMIGGAYYIGDLNPRRHFFLTQPAAGVFYRFTPNYRYAFRGGFYFGNIFGDDSQTDDADQIQRNLNFKTQILELNLLAEFNFLEYRISNDKYKFTTFLFLGVDVFRFNPQTRFGNAWISTQPLRTEGQSKSYKLTQVAIPFGVGAKINVSKKVGIGLEWGPRKTFTDYLDDVSGTYPDWTSAVAAGVNSVKLSDRSINAGNNINKQRGNPRTKDWYFFFGITLNFKIDFVKPPCYTTGF